MKRSLLILLVFAMALPVYWTVEKGFQRLAVSAVAKKISGEVTTPGFLMKKFELEMPLRHVYQVFSGASTHDNHVRDIIEIFLDEKPKNRTVALKIIDKKGQTSWYLYPLETCGQHYCPYDVENLTPIPAVSLEDATEVYFNDSEIIESYGFNVLISYNWTKSASGAFIYASISLADEATNPFDRAVRELENGGPPNYWSQKWQMTFDYASLRKVEEKSNGP